MKVLKLLLVLLVFVIGCSTAKHNRAEVKKSYTTAYQQIATPPTYYPVRWVRPPSPNIASNQKSATAKVIPVYHYSLPESTLCEISTALAASLRYSSYCSSLLKNKAYSLETVSTPYEVKSMLEKDTGIKVVIDSVNREVRFLANDPTTPKFN